MKLLKQDGKEPVRAPQRHDVLPLVALEKGNLNQTLRSRDENIRKSDDDQEKLKVEGKEHGDKYVRKKEYGRAALLKYIKQKRLDVGHERLVAEKEGPGNIDAGLPKLGGQNLSENVIPEANDVVKKSVGAGGVGVDLQQGGGNKTVQFKSRGLKGIDGQEILGSLPWEEEGIFDSIQKVGCGDAFSQHSLSKK